MPEVLIGVALVIFIPFTAALKLARVSSGHASPCLRSIVWATGVLSITLYVLGVVAMFVRSDGL